MRQLIANFHISLDGVVQSPGGPDEDPRGGFTLGGWSMPYDDDLVGETVMATISEPHDLLLGRRTYEIWAAYWPHAGENPIADKFNGAVKFVPSNTLSEPAWQNTELLSGEAADAVARVKATDGPDLHLWGSADLMQTLNAAGLVDEYRLWIYPIVLGSGLRLFEQGTPPFGLKLVKAQTSPNGIVIATYTGDGPVRLGSFAQETPSEAEIARRRKLAQE